jgi:hypothetical protein
MKYSKIAKTEFHFPGTFSGYQLIYSGKDNIELIFAP